MKISDHEEALERSYERVTIDVHIAQPRSSRTAKQVLARRDPLAPYPRCKCGICPRCIDFDKWDRKFAKFAMSDYGDMKGMFQSPLRDIG